VLAEISPRLRLRTVWGIELPVSFGEGGGTRLRLEFPAVAQQQQRERHPEQAVRALLAGQQHALRVADLGADAGDAGQRPGNIGHPESRNDGAILSRESGSRRNV